MKNYIQPTIKSMKVKTSECMQTLVLSDTEGYGGPMGNEGTFDEYDNALPSAKNVWE